MRKKKHWSQLQPDPEEVVEWSDSECSASADSEPHEISNNDVTSEPEAEEYDGDSDQSAQAGDVQDPSAMEEQVKAWVKDSVDNWEIMRYHHFRVFWRDVFQKYQQKLAKVRSYTGLFTSY